ncbi:MAG: phosphoribosyltransferase [Gammaproteobacteria bacterium]
MPYHLACYNKGSNTKIGDAMRKYKNRREAGKILAQYLQQYAGESELLVLALPRGGVPVAYEVASALKAPLDVFIVRKLGVPSYDELAMGAIASGGTVVLNKNIINEFQVSKEALDLKIEQEKRELKRREQLYRHNHAYPDLSNKKIILIDDGIATAATIEVAILALRKLNPVKIIVAVPVASDAYRKISGLVDEFICPLLPEHFSAVGEWYDDFQQTEDEEVFNLLNQSHNF